MNLLLWVGVALAGGAGALLRFLVDGQVSARVGRSFPYGTLVVNVSGAVALGLLIGMTLRPETVLLAGTGAVGAYTTFSTWMFETQRLGEDRQLTGLLSNIVVSLLAGILAAEVGAEVGRALGGAL
ncbi:MAG: fluoride efflux transporter CrcB [Pseudonocardia sp.]|nr:fluoride efflux transporter CrcB [Pseudonocardia sp.]